MTFNHLVLIGGGHSNVSLLKKWLMFPKLMPAIPVSIISRDSHLVYSAIFPSVISKSITLEESLIDIKSCLLYTSPSPRDAHESRMPSSA